MYKRVDGGKARTYGDTGTCSKHRGNNCQDLLGPEVDMIQEGREERVRTVYCTEGNGDLRSLALQRLQLARGSVRHPRDTLHLIL